MFLLKNLKSLVVLILVPSSEKKQQALGVCYTDLQFLFIMHFCRQTYSYVSIFAFSILMLLLFFVVQICFSSIYLMWYFVKNDRSSIKAYFFVQNLGLFLSIRNSYDFSHQSLCNNVSSSNLTHFYALIF